MSAETTARLEELVRRHRFLFNSETDLQAGIADMLTEQGIDHEREVRLSASDRIDLMVGRVGVEVKARRGVPRAEVLAQVQRYGRSPDVDALILVTTLAAHTTLPMMVGGIPLTVVLLGGVV